MISVRDVIQDANLGFTSFTVRRTTYHRRNGQTEPTERDLSAGGIIHPGPADQIQLLPEEERSETYIEIFTSFTLTTGENFGASVYTAPDRILWQNDVYRVIRVRSWQQAGYSQALAVMLHE